MQHSKLHQNPRLNKLYFAKKPMRTAPRATSYSNPFEPLDLPLYPAARQTYNNRPKAPNTKQNQCKRMPNGRVCNLCLRYLLHARVVQPVALQVLRTAKCAVALINIRDQAPGPFRVFFPCISEFLTHQILLVSNSPYQDCNGCHREDKRYPGTKHQRRAREEQNEPQISGMSYA